MFLENLKIASPCHADWDNMQGDDRVQFCGECQKSVFNVSAMTRRQAESFLRQNTTGICTKIYRRADGQF